MLIKLKISGTIEVLTGLHIGGNSSFSAIGAVDNVIVTDTMTGLPLLPGSSLKGKMRSLLAREYNQSLAIDPNNDCDIILNLFGASKENSEGKIISSRLLFSDTIAYNDKSKDLVFTEIKFENTINRATAVANPRQIERVIRGINFPLELIYEAPTENGMLDDVRMLEEVELIANGLTLLEYDYLGGHGSRGYGRVKFKNVRIDCVFGKVNEELDEAIKESQKIFDRFNGE